MAQPTRKTPRGEDTTGFDVTCVVGRVEYGASPHSAEVAAFMLIAEHGTSGQFVFPGEDGGTVYVTVDRNG